MDNSLKVSIIIPVHNAATTIEFCIKSILEQDYENIECILVENASADASERICREYAKKERRIHVTVSQYSGVSKARNLGLSMATGDIIGFCDADDILEAGAISTIVSIFQDKPDIIGVISAFYIGRMTEHGIEKQYKGIKKRELSEKEAMRLILGCNQVMGSVWNKYYRASFVKQISFDENLSYCEDMHFNMKVLADLSSVKLCYTNLPLYCYMMNNQSVTHQSPRLFDKNDELKYIIAMKKILSDCNLSIWCQSIVKMKIASFAIDYFYRKNVSDLQRANLYREIKDNSIYLILNVFSYDIITNFKRLVKLILITIKK